MARFGANLGKFVLKDSLDLSADVRTSSIDFFVNDLLTEKL